MKYRRHMVITWYYIQFHINNKELILSAAPLHSAWHITHYQLAKGGQTAILVRWSAVQRTTEMLADQRQRVPKLSFR